MHMNARESSTSDTPQVPAAPDAPVSVGGKSQQLPAGAGRIGMYLFLAALFMLFGGSMVGYALVRIAATRDVIGVPGTATRFGLPLGSLDLPKILWLSTFLMICVSLVMHAAVTALRRDAQTLFRRLLVAAAALAVGFLAVQAPALASLLAEHQQKVHADTALYGLIFVFILLHAAHVLGGLIPMGIVTVRGLHGRYDSRNASGVANTALYWHFLDIVWLGMYGVMLGLG